MRKTPTVPTLAAALLLILTAVPALAGDGGSAYATLMDEHYEPVRMALLHDHLDGVAGHAEEIAAAVRALEDDFSARRAGVPAGETAAVKALLPQIAAAAEALAAAGDVEAARAAFGDLSAPLVRWHGRLAADDGRAVGTCPMVDHNWLQPAEAELGNPYMGQKMARCGKLMQG